MKYVKSGTGHASNAELDLAENEITSCQKKREYQGNIPKNTKKELGEYALIHRTEVAIKLKCSARNTKLSNLTGLR